jgi:septum formation protein
VTARRFVLASASPARAALLRSCGVAAEVVISGVDEVAVAGTAPPDPPGQAAALATAKARAVAALPGVAGALVLGCDSTLVIDGVGASRPADVAEARRWWQDRRGTSAPLLTGHHLVDTATGRSATEVVSTTVRFGCPDDVDLERYLATGEPLQVAGAFTLEGRGGAFLRGVDGDPTSVLGLSLPALDRLLRATGSRLTDLWT